LKITKAKEIFKGYKEANKLLDEGKSLKIKNHWITEV
jgi:hypothetical protein